MNNVILDVVIGIIFIFLLYSLLATSIQEAIATGFSIRARMLRSGIINGMLSNTSTDTRWQSIAKGITCFLKNIWIILVRKPQPKKTGLGQLFYDHPLIKNYGSSRVFSNPSYLPTANFSTVLIDVLLSDFDLKITAIATLKSGQDLSQIPVIQADLVKVSDAIKIKELLSFYGSIYADRPSQISTAEDTDHGADKGGHGTDTGVGYGADNGNRTGTDNGFVGLSSAHLIVNKLISTGTLLNIEKDTWQILNLHFRTSLNNMETFAAKLQTWFDDSMDRVAGWYKRQVQVILFIIGLTLAILFNLDIIQISGKLSTDKDARDQLVRMAVNQAESYRDDPRVKSKASSDTTKKATASADSIFRHYQQHIEEAKTTVLNSVTPANKLLALGWGDYGKSNDSAKILSRYYNHSAICNQRLGPEKHACQIHNGLQLDSVFAAHATSFKLSYIGSSLLNASKFAGILLTAFAISLGAPFWFDLLNKFMNLRASGKKEDKTSKQKTMASGSPKPVIVNLVNPPIEEEVAG